MRRFSILFVALCGPAWAECPGGAEPVFACSLLNSDDVELCVVGDQLRMRMGFDVDDPAEEVFMPLSIMPYMSTGMAQSGEDFAYAKFFQGDRAYTVGLDRDLDMASVAVGSPIDYIPDVDYSCSDDGLIDNFAVLDVLMNKLGRRAPVVAAQPVGADCGPVQTLGPADWHDDKDVSPIHIQPKDTVIEVLFVDDRVRVCGPPVDGWFPVRYLSDAFNCDLSDPDVPGAVCSSGWVHRSQLEASPNASRPQALACQAGGFRFAMVSAENGVVTVMNEELSIRLEPGDGPKTAEDLGNVHRLRLDSELELVIDYEELTVEASHLVHGTQSGQCAVVDTSAILSK